MFDRITWSNIELESVRLCDGDRMNIMLINIRTPLLLIVNKYCIYSCDDKQCSQDDSLSQEQNTSESIWK